MAQLKAYRIYFESKYNFTDCGMIVAAHDKEEALTLAKQKFSETEWEPEKILNIEELILEAPMVLLYVDGGIDHNYD